MKLLKILVATALSASVLVVQAKDPDEDESNVEKLAVGCSAIEPGEQPPSEDRLVEQQLAVFSFKEEPLSEEDFKCIWSRNAWADRVWVQMDGKPLTLKETYPLETVETLETLLFAPRSEQLCELQLDANKGELIDSVLSLGRNLNIAPGRVESKIALAVAERNRQTQRNQIYQQ